MKSVENLEFEDGAGKLSPGLLKLTRIASRIRLRTGHVFVLCVIVLGPIPRHPAWIAAGVFLVLYGLLLRVASASQIRKNRELAVSGPYRYTRNPLYFGSFAISLGLSALAPHWVTFAVLFAILGSLYHLTMLGEEEFLSAKFGKTYAEFLRSTPRFLPRVAGLIPWSWLQGFDKSLLKRNKELNTAAVMAVVVILMIIKAILRWEMPIW